MHQPQHQVGNITGLNGGTPQQQYANSPWNTGNMTMNTPAPMVLQYTRGPTVMSQHTTRINNVADQTSIEYKKKAVELLNQQLQHKFKLLEDIAVKMKHTDKPEYAEFVNNLKKLAKVDNDLLKIWDKIPGILQKINRTGKNKGIDLSFYRLIHGYFHIQDMLLVKYYNRGQSDPELKPLIDLLGDKIWLLTDVMKTSLPEEAEMQGLQDIEYPDLDKIIHQGDIKPHVQGANENQNNVDKIQLQRLYGFI